LAQGRVERTGRATGGPGDTSELLEAAWSRTDRDRRYVTDALHDNVVQALLALTWQLDDLDGAAAALLRGQIDRVVGDMWGLIGELSPTATVAESLRDALEQQLADMTRSSGLALTLDLDNGGTIDVDRQLVLLRVCREAVANVLSHAEASTVTIRCRHRRQQVFLHVCDDGVGADPHWVRTQMRQGRYGLRSIHWAVQSRGGRIRLRSHPGAGFAIHVILPAAATLPTP
jgi:two-component system, NarL family, sensor kinase